MRLAASLIVQPDAVTISRKPLPGCGGFFIIFLISLAVFNEIHIYGFAILKSKNNAPVT